MGTFFINSDELLICHLWYILNLEHVGFDYATYIYISWVEGQIFVKKNNLQNVLAGKQMFQITWNG